MPLSINWFIFCIGELYSSCISTKCLPAVHVIWDFIFRQSRLNWIPEWSKRLWLQCCLQNSPTASHCNKNAYDFFKWFKETERNLKIFKTWDNNLPSHLFPNEYSGQIQLKSYSRSSQVPPFIHGDSLSHTSPSKTTK